MIVVSKSGINCKLAYRGSMAVSIEGPPEGDKIKVLATGRLPKSSSLDNAEDAADLRNASVAMRGLSLAWRANSMTKRSTAAGSFWSSMFRTAKDGRFPLCVVRVAELYCGKSSR